MITVIADDITGAAEMAGVCIRYGLTVTFGIDSIPNVKADVRVIATDSRSLSEMEAYKIHHKLAVKIFTDPNAIVFKKCDSILRGFVLTELAALLDTGHFENTLLQPANPATERCIKDGTYYIGNLKIENTGFSVDPDFPADNSQIQNLLLQRSVHQSCISEVHTGRMTEIKGEGVFVPDCLSVGDLRQCCSLATENTLLCGSAAFFEQILLYKKLVEREKKHSSFNIPTNFLLVCGSSHPQSRQFVEQMQLSGSPVLCFPENVLQQDVTQATIVRWTEVLIATWKRSHKLILSISSKNVGFPNSSTILKTRMNMIVSEILKQCDIMEILIEGGATAYGILNTINWKTLTPIQELAPGVLRMQVSGLPATYLTIKPGSYLWPEGLIDKSN